MFGLESASDEAMNRTCILPYCFWYANPVAHGQTEATEQLSSCRQMCDLFSGESKSRSIRPLPNPVICLWVRELEV